MQENELKAIISHFGISGTVDTIKPLGNGLINDTYKVNTLEQDQSDYVLQRINNAVFTDVELLQHNIEAVTAHIRKKLMARNESDIDRKVLTFIPTAAGKTYFKDDSDRFWRVSVFIPNAKTYEAV